VPKNIILDSGSDSEGSSSDISSQLSKPYLVRLHANLLTAQIRLRAAGKKIFTLSKTF